MAPRMEDGFVVGAGNPAENYPIEFRADIGNRGEAARVAQNVHIRTAGDLDVSLDKVRCAVRASLVAHKYDSRIGRDPRSHAIFSARSGGYASRHGLMPAPRWIQMERVLGAALCDDELDLFLFRIGQVKIAHIEMLIDVAHRGFRLKGRIAIRVYPDFPACLVPQHGKVFMYAAAGCG